MKSFATIHQIFRNIQLSKDGLFCGNGGVLVQIGGCSFSPEAQKYFQSTGTDASNFYTLLSDLRFFKLHFLTFPFDKQELYMYHTSQQKLTLFQKIEFVP